MEEIDASIEDSGAPSTPVKRRPGRPRKSESKRAKPFKLNGRGSNTEGRDERNRSGSAV